MVTNGDDSGACRPFAPPLPKLRQLPETRLAGVLHHLLQPTQMPGPVDDEDAVVRRRRECEDVPVDAGEDAGTGASAAARQGRSHRRSHGLLDSHR
jgi:hypothetical protein